MGDLKLTKKQRQELEFLDAQLQNHPIIWFSNNLKKGGSWLAPPCCYLPKVRPVAAWEMSLSVTAQ